MRKSLKMTLITMIIAIVICMLNVTIVKAASSSITGSKTVTVGESVTINASVNAGAWNVVLSGNGQTKELVGQTATQGNSSASTSITFTPNKAETYTFTLSGDITDYETEKTDSINKTCTITVKEKETSGGGSNSNTGSGSNTGTGSNAGSGSNQGSSGNSGSNSGSNNNSSSGNSSNAPSFTSVNETVYGVLGISIEKKQLESFEKSILQAIIGECALALENEQITIEKEKAAILAKNEQLRSNLLRAISHDLRTPLTSISGNASNLLSNADYFDKETKKQLYLDIYDDSMWLINLIENMLSVTRLEEGRMNLNISVELVDDVIQEALRHVDRKKDEHTITVEHEDELLLARMDSRLIVQMVINLVDNAIKYTQKGSHIDIRTGREGKNAVISVADDGPGISDEMKEHIFETFYTGTNKIADSRRSLGLGLALCKSIVNVHGGEIKVSDAHPHGAVFQFTLPAGEVYLYEQTTDIGCGR